MTVTSDVQYSAGVAGVYDAVIGATMPAADSLTWLEPYVHGRRVLDLGVGTGRLAIPMAAVAESVVGVDNSAQMLERLHAKDRPGNLTTHIVDFRRPLPFPEAQFTAAVSTMGSFACVRSREELRHGFDHVATVLADLAPFVVEYYSAATYRALLGLGPLTVPNEHHPSSSTMSIRIHDSQLKVSTTITPHDGSELVEFDESVLLLEHVDLVEIAAAAGFSLQHYAAAEDFAPFDRYVLVRDSR